jgi:hypothetical protein
VNIVKHIAAKIEDSYRLRGVPPPVIEEVVRLALETLEVVVPAHALAAEVMATDWEFCEGCRALIDPQEPAGAGTDGEGFWLCDACRVEAPTPTPAEPVETKG